MSDPSRPKLVLQPHHVKQIIDHARDARPHEACGFLGGRKGHVEKVYPLPNTEESPIRYLAEPQAQLDAMLEIEDLEWEIVGIYHSHLDSPAYPSSTDVAMAAYPDAFQLIVSLSDPECPELGAFQIRGEQVEEVDLVIETPNQNET